jgi:hypothetical protein
VIAGSTSADGPAEQRLPQPAGTGVRGGQRERGATHDGDGQARQRDLQRVRQRLRDGGTHVLAVLHGGAEVAVQGRPQLLPVLDEHGLIEAVAGPQRVQLRRWQGLAVQPAAGHRGHRVAGHQVEHDERDGEGRPQHRDRERDAAQQVAAQFVARHAGLFHVS